MKEISAQERYRARVIMKPSPPSWSLEKLSSTKLMPKRLGTAAVDNACSQLQGLGGGINDAPEKRHQGDGRETQRGMSVTEPAGGVSKRKWSGCEVVPVEKRMQIRSFWLLFNQQFKQHCRIGP